MVSKREQGKETNMPNNNTPRLRAPNVIATPSGFRTWESFKQSAKQKVPVNFGQPRLHRPANPAQDAINSNPDNFELFAFGVDRAKSCTAFVDKIRDLNFEVFFGNHPPQANFAPGVMIVARNQTTCDWRRLFCLFENVQESQAVGINAMTFFWDN